MSIMKVRRTIRVRVRAGSRAGYDRLAQLAGADRFVNNHLAAYLRDLEESRGAPLSERDTHYHRLCLRHTELRRDTPWMRELPSCVTRMSGRRIGADYKRHRKDPARYGKPGFKRKFLSPESFAVPGGSFKLPRGRTFRRGDSVYIAKTGTYRLLGGNPYPDGVVDEIVFKRELGKWYAYLMMTVEIPDRAPTGKSAGIDRNGSNVAVHDGGSGHIHEPPNSEVLWARARRYQRKLARLRRLREKTGLPGQSNNYYRTREKLQRTLRLIASRMTDWRHKLTTALARDHDVLYLEKLDLRAMTAAGGARKRGMNREMLRMGHGATAAYLRYKGEVREVPAAYTSQMCSKCHHTEPGNRRSRAVFKCLACGYRDHADLNAASNVLASGTGASGQGRQEGAAEPGRDPGVSRKHQPIDADEGPAAAWPHASFDA